MSSHLGSLCPYFGGIRLEELQNTYIHIHVHTYMYIHTYIHTYIHSCMYACIHTYIHTYIHTCMHTHIHTYIRMYTYVCMYAYVYMYVHTYVHTYAYTYMRACVHECMHAYVRTHVTRVYIQTYRRSHNSFTYTCSLLCYSTFSPTTTYVGLQADPQLYHGISRDGFCIQTLRITPVPQDVSGNNGNNTLDCPTRHVGIHGCRRWHISRHVESAVFTGSDPLCYCPASRPPWPGRLSQEFPASGLPSMDNNSQPTRSQSNQNEFSPHS